jgi:hypothetical protein
MRHLIASRGTGITEQRGRQTPAANVKISELTNIPAPADGDMLELDTGAASGQATKAQFLAAIQAEVDANTTGPASAVDSNFAAFDGTTGKLVKDSGYAASAFATAAQGATADTATQPGDNVSTLTNDAGYIASVSEDTAPTLGGNLTLNGNSLIDVETAEAGNTFAAGEIGYRDASNQIVKASAAAEAASQAAQRALRYT